MAVIEQSARPGLRTGLRTEPGRTRLALPVVLYMFAVILPIGFNFGSLYLTLIRIILLITIIPLTLKLLTGKYGGVLWADLMFFLHTFWIALAVAMVEPDRAVQFVGSTAVEFIGSYVLARAYIRTAADMIALVRLLVLAIILTLPLAPPELLTNVPPVLSFLEKLPFIRTFESVQSSDEYRMGLYRVQAVFPHPIHYGMFCSIGFALCFIGLKDVYSTSKRYAATALVALGVFVSLSSGALLPIFLQIFMIGWAWVLGGVRLRWLYLALLTVAGYIAVDIISNRPPMIAILSYVTFSSWNAYWRALIFEFGIQNVWAHPLFGLGITADWVRPKWMYSGSVDNFWLVIAMRHGIPAFVFLALGILWPMWKIGRRALPEGTAVWQLRRGWMIVMVCLILALCTVHIWATLFSFYFFIVGAGMWFLTVPTDAETPAPSGPPRRGGPPRPEIAPQAAEMTAGPRYSRFPGKSRAP